MRQTRPASLSERRRGYRRALGAGLAISAVIHLVVLFSPAGFEIPEPAVLPSDRPMIEMQGQMAVSVGRLVPAGGGPPGGGIVPLDGAMAQPAAVPEPEEVPQRPEEAEEVPDEAAGAARAAVGGEAATRGLGRPGEGHLTNAEKLQPKEGDERLWEEYEEDEIPEYLAQNPYARYEGEIRARLSVMLDSLNLSEEQRRKAIEWLTGESGEEWGVSADGIHLGGVVIPINLQSLFAEEGPHGRESRQEARDLEQIRMQDMIGEAQETREERARQMRERTKEELERRLQDSLKAAADSAAVDSAAAASPVTWRPGPR